MPQLPRLSGRALTLRDCRDEIDRSIRLLHATEQAILEIAQDEYSTAPTAVIDVVVANLEAVNQRLGGVR